MHCHAWRGNDFVVVGPPQDAPGVDGRTNAAAALARIAATGARFAPRRDHSGTHKKEMALWEKVGVDVAEASGRWYRETGSGTGATLNVAVGMGAYTLTNRGTWIGFKNERDHQILVEGSECNRHSRGQADRSLAADGPRPPYR